MSTVQLLSSASNSFPLYDLNRLCFLAVAEQLDNTGRRYLSQTCQRFRRLLIPDDRYIDHPSSYWDEDSLDTEVMFKRSRRPTTSETRRSFPKIEFRQFGNNQFKIKVTKDRGDKYGPEMIILSLCSFDPQNEEYSLYKSHGKLLPNLNGAIMHGAFPTLIYETIWEANKYCVFRDSVRISITSPVNTRLPLMIYTKNNFYDIPFFVEAKMCEIGMRVDDVRRLAIDYTEYMPAKSRLRLKIDYFRRELTLATTLTVLKALKQLWLECSTAVEWKRERLEPEYPISISKTEENTLVVRYDGDFENQF